MALHWKTVRNMHAGNQVTDFRLSRSTNHYPTDPESIWWSALVDLSGISINDFEAQVLASYPQDLLIPNDYDHYDRAQVSSRQIVAIFARRILLSSLNQNGANFSVTGVHLGSIIDPELLDFSAQIEEVPSAKIPVSKGTIITAVIDDSIAFAHNLFRDGLTSTRVAFANILTVKPNRSGRDKTYGRTYDKAAIDDLLKTCTTNDLLDEQKFYASVGLFDAHDNEVSAVALRRSHGTHVMALATGYSMSQPPPDRPIICALLPSHVTQDSTGQSTLPSLILALKRIQRQAAQFRLPDRKRPPVVVNFSYGNFGGPHDGTGPIDRVIAQFLGDESPRKFEQEMRLVLPAGNGNLQRIHAKLAFDKGLAANQERSISLRSQMTEPLATCRCGCPIAAQHQSHPL
ncbi:hypothetical protein EBB79_23225 (plasmid) [Parasedimentitalea marina]|uniref:Peptidase S8/S53 domain-containing protein n=1 Tax=Parasedimentitalea marina TaxID=2483033 RepID=A0A3T0NA44_9RHOB|nr:hypothetical protein [Parasedimentitalea marina]AZV80861.1 hypothetical protein EBB79_23225 [Parasedimentitalea marina]